MPPRHRAASSRFAAALRLSPGPDPFQTWRFSPPPPILALARSLAGLLERAEAIVPHGRPDILCFHPNGHHRRITTPILRVDSGDAFVHVQEGRVDAVRWRRADADSTAAAGAAALLKPLGTEMAEAFARLGRRPSNLLLQAHRPHGSTQICFSLSHPVRAPGSPRPFHLLFGQDDRAIWTLPVDNGPMTELARHGAAALDFGQERILLPFPTAHELLDETLFMAAASDLARDAVRRWRQRTQASVYHNPLVIERNPFGCFVFSGDWALEAGVAAAPDRPAVSAA